MKQGLEAENGMKNVAPKVSVWRQSFMVMAVLMLLWSAGIWFYLSPASEGNLVSKEIEIPVGSATIEIANILHDNEIIKSPLFFRVVTRWEGKDNQMKAGVYLLNSSMSISEIIQTITAGRSLDLTVTIPEGYNLKQITKLLAEKKLIDSQQFAALAKNGEKLGYDFLKPQGSFAGGVEGFLFPDTYRFPKNIKAEEIMNILLDQFKKKVLTPEIVQKATALGLTIPKLITFASIVEKEAKSDQDRPLVAAVFWNRLKKNMKLQSDVTVQYLLPNIKPKLTYKDLEVNSPYNTYQVTGLPPAPIASPGLASIRAVLNPAKTDYLYFYVDQNGKFYFSHSYDEHLKIQRKLDVNSH